MRGVPPFISDYLILIWVLVSVLSAGMALCLRFTRLQGIELIGYGAGAGVVVHGILGVLIALNRHLRHSVGLLAICGAAFALGYLIRRRVWRDLKATLGTPLRLTLMLWLLLLMSCLALAHVDVRWPEVLPDGQFVFKKHTLNVKIQVMAGLPVDNSIPHIVTEFFLRDVSFKKEHPILPENEVSNRTILMSLVALPFRAVLGWDQGRQNSLGTFSYVGKEWPDVEKLSDDKSINHLFIIGLFLNSLMLLGLLVLFSNFDAPKSIPVAALLYITNPYFIGQTIFTWPKAMAAFFVLLCWNSARRNHDPKIVGLAAALAYHCHPASLAVAGGVGLCYGIRAWRQKSSFRPMIEYGAVFLLMILPWLVWTRFVLHLPTNLLAQNLSGAGSADLIASPINFVWVRFHNVMVSLIPVSFIVYPFDLTGVVYYAMHCLPTVVGLFLIVPALQECAQRWKSERMFLLYGMLLPAAAILLVFSLPARPVLYGWQPMVGALLFLGALRLRRNFSAVTYRAVIVAQIICNLAVLVARGFLVGAHFG
jgi:hypothetical protein